MRHKGPALLTILYHTLPKRSHSNDRAAEALSFLVASTQQLRCGITYKRQCCTCQSMIGVSQDSKSAARKRIFSKNNQLQACKKYK